MTCGLRAMEDLEQPIRVLSFFAAQHEKHDDEAKQKRVNFPANTTSAIVSTSCMANSVFVLEDLNCQVVSDSV